MFMKIIINAALIKEEKVKIIRITINLMYVK